MMVGYDNLLDTASDVIGIHAGLFKTEMQQEQGFNSVMKLSLKNAI